MSAPANDTCIRCGHDRCDVGRMYAAGGFWSKIFDVEGRQFSTLTCKRRKHTEFFQADENALHHIVDLFVT